MADVTILGDLPSMTAITITTTAQEVVMHPRAKSAILNEKGANTLFSWDGTTYATLPNAENAPIWYSDRANGARSVWLKTSTGTHITHISSFDG